MVDTSSQAGGEKREARPTTPERNLSRGRNPAANGLPPGENPPEHIAAPARYHKSLVARLRRRAFHTAALASAFLLLAILILWPRSYFRYDTVYYGAATNLACSISSSAGRVDGYGGRPKMWEIGFDCSSDPRDFTTEWQSWSYWKCAKAYEYAYHYTFLGCEYSVLPRARLPEQGFVIYLPYSYLAVLSAITPAFWLLTRNRRRHRDRLANGLCPLCGYDLRGHASIPNPRCPECGSPAPPAQPA